jgi:hypothetical protein
MGVHRLAFVRSSVAAVAVLAALAGGGCDAPWTDPFAGALDDAAEDARDDDSGEATIDFRDAADFDWDRVIFFGAYADRQEAESRLGFSWPEANDEFSSDDQDRFLVFTEGEKVVKVINYRVGDDRTNLACVTNDEDGYSRGEGSFRVVRVDEPELLFSTQYVLVPGTLSKRGGEDFLIECGFLLPRP